MKIIILIILFCSALTVKASNQANGDVTLRDTRVNEFTSNGSSKFEHCVFSNSLTVNGSADIYHSKMKFGIIKGSLKAHGLDARSLDVSGSVSLNAKSDVSDLKASGSLDINDSYVDIVILEGSAYGNGAYIKKITVTNGDLHFIDSDIGKVFINSNNLKKEPIVIKLVGKTTIRHLTIDGPKTLIIFDNESRKTFDKSIVVSNGKVDYK